MVARVGTVAFQGIEVLDVDVQVQMAPGLPVFAVVGLPDKTVAEARERALSIAATGGRNRLFFDRIAPPPAVREV